MARSNFALVADGPVCSERTPYLVCPAPCRQKPTCPVSHKDGDLPNNWYLLHGYPGVDCIVYLRLPTTAPCLELYFPLHSNLWTISLGSI